MCVCVLVGEHVGNEEQETKNTQKKEETQQNAIQDLMDVVVLRQELLGVGRRLVQLLEHLQQEAVDVAQAVSLLVRLR